MQDDTCHLLYTRYTIFNEFDLYSTLRKALPGDYITLITDNQEGYKEYKVLMKDGAKILFVMADIYQTYDEPVNDTYVS